MIKTACPLFNECRSLATRTRDVHFAEWTRHELSECEQFYYTTAELEAGRIVLFGEDAGIVTRAIRFLARQPIPREFVPWFRERLGALLDLACPEHASPVCGEPFFQDLARGMNSANERGVRRSGVEEYQAVEWVGDEIQDRSRPLV